ncbi:MAG: hypothetical protein ACRDMX_08135 [Solirubrobacteraceae bacterium]
MTRYAGDGDIYVMGADGTDVRQLTHGLDASGPAWSPDGSRIAFITGQGQGLAVMRADGTDRHVIARARGYYESPAWSPNGRMIAYQSTPHHSIDVTAIFTIRPDGTHERQLTPASAGAGFPAWSPDGSRIAYSAGGQLWVMNSDGTRTRRLTDCRVPCVADFAPAWSPDGSDLVFVQQENGGGARRLYILALATGAITPLTPTVRWAGSPDWRAGAGPTLAQLKANFAVLRRPQTAADRSWRAPKTAMPGLTRLAQRLPASPNSAYPVRLFIAVEHDRTPTHAEQSPGGYRLDLYTVAANGNVAHVPFAPDVDSDVFPLDVLARYGGGWMLWAGIVPDGVSRVRWRFGCSPATKGCLKPADWNVEIPVRGNTAAAAVPNTGSCDVCGQPQAVTWYRADGRVVASYSSTPKHSLTAPPLTTRRHRGSLHGLLVASRPPPSVRDRAAAAREIASDARVSYATVTCVDVGAFSQRWAPDRRSAYDCKEERCEAKSESPRGSSPSCRLPRWRMRPPGPTRDRSRSSRDAVARSQSRSRPGSRFACVPRR